jgi:hypothetical protein
MKKTPEQLIAIYRASLAKYEASGDPNAVVQRRRIAALEVESKAGRS